VEASGLSVSYVTDPEGDRGTLTVRYPFELDVLDEDCFNSIGLVAGVFIGQLCLAKRIQFDFATPDGALQVVTPLAEILYDVRCAKERFPLLDAPAMEAMAKTSTTFGNLDGDTRRVCLLWSGGKDSTLAAIKLLQNSYDVRPVHFSANIGVEDAERVAVDRLARALGLSVLHISFEFPEMLALAAKYSRKWDRFPAYNRVPFGRDMLLCLMTVPYLRRIAASTVSIGHDRDCKSNTVTYYGKVIPRNDVESTAGALALETFIRHAISPSIRLLPPLAGLREFRILYEMLVYYPELMAQTSFCFWGSNCGLCAKCLRYYLVQRALAVNVIRFQANPLFEHVCPELDDYLRDWRDPEVLFGEEVLYCLGRLVQRGEGGAGEISLQRFAREAFPTIAPRLDTLEEGLLARYEDPQIPREFEVSPKPLSLFR
jgi:7-cyano-7-deazaguanine synthase in queuosine biosynthesis